MAAERDEAAWVKALSRAALKGACRIEFSYTQPAKTEVSYHLSCLDEKGEKMGDARDYDILKAVIVPLEKLCEREKPPFSLALELKTGRLILPESG